MGFSPRLAIRRGLRSCARWRFMRNAAHSNFLRSRVNRISAITFVYCATPDWFRRATKAVTSSFGCAANSSTTCFPVYSTAFSAPRRRRTSRGRQAPTCRHLRRSLFQTRRCERARSRNTRIRAGIAKPNAIVSHRLPLAKAHDAYKQPVKLERRYHSGAQAAKALPV